MQIEMCRYITDNLFDGVYYVNLERKITYWSKGAERITGYNAEEVLGSSCSDNILRHIDDEGNELCNSGCPLGETIQEGEVRDAYVYLHHKKGYRMPVRVRVVPTFDNFGRVNGAVEIFQDVSKRSELIKELENLKKEILLDSLTGVGNRRLTEIALKEAMSYYEKQKVLFGIVFIDIDHFKNFNDTYGHNVGDQVLKMVAKTISNLSRPLDTVTRLGGEEFVVVVPDIDMKVLQKIAERVRSFVEKTWIMVQGEKVQVTVSIGATIVKDGESGAEVLKRADTLMYESKKSGRNMVTSG